MAFKKVTPQAACPESPDKLFLELPRRKIPGLLVHQGEVLKNYASQTQDASDVAMQLPTGSGKTLVGLLVGEWRRRKNNERIVYLCPTKQLVNQVVEQAQDQYGLTVRGFHGKINKFNPMWKTDYQRADKIAVTTYSHLFNTNPFFGNGDVIILDDVHAAENYIAKMWSLRIGRTENSALHAVVAGVLKRFISPIDYSKLIAEAEEQDRKWVDKLPTPRLHGLANELIQILDVHCPGTDLEYSWDVLKDHFVCCNLYMTGNEILLRPLIPPTWDHPAFAEPKQRIYMSATLGGGGDLERMTGRRSIKRLKVPEGWDKQGIGRRYFIFPGLSFGYAEIAKLRTALMLRAGRSLVLVPSDFAKEAVSEEVAEIDNLKIFDAAAIEESKKPFVSEALAVAIIANRYDGIDFPGDDCRLLFVDGLPRAMNAQERFFMSRMGCNIIFNDRVQTRVVQAIGRCTRSLADYSAVVVTGEELSDYLIDKKRNVHLHPEVQAELEFGIVNSTGVSISDLVENFDIFLANGEEWERGANQEILTLRASKTQKTFPAMDQLQGVVEAEISYQEHMWHGDYPSAFAKTKEIIARLTDPELRGYRAVWNYFAGASAWLAGQNGIPNMGTIAKEHFSNAKDNAKGLPWLVSLSQFVSDAPVVKTEQEKKRHIVELQLERVEESLARLGTCADRNFNMREKEILDGLSSKEPGPFERAHVLLGEMLGFFAGNEETDAAPDPWWIIDDLCLVFEDHQGASAGSKLDATKARQVATHPNWIRANPQKAPLALNGTCIAVLVSPVKRAESGAMPHLEQVFIWPLDEFREWGKNALNTLRKLRLTFIQAGDLVWRADACEEFEKQGLDGITLIEKVKGRKGSDYLTL